MNNFRTWDKNENKTLSWNVDWLKDQAHRQEFEWVRLAWASLKMEQCQKITKGVLTDRMELLKKLFTMANIPFGAFAVVPLQDVLDGKHEQFGSQPTRSDLCTMVQNGRYCAGVRIPMEAVTREEVAPASAVGSNLASLCLMCSAVRTQSESDCNYMTMLGDDRAPLVIVEKKPNELPNEFQGKCGAKLQATIRTVIEIMSILFGVAWDTDDMKDTILIINVLINDYGVLIKLTMHI